MIAYSKGWLKRQLDIVARAVAARKEFEALPLEQREALLAARRRWPNLMERALKS